MHQHHDYTLYRLAAKKPGQLVHSTCISVGLFTLESVNSDLQTGVLFSLCTVKKPLGVLVSAIYFAALKVIKELTVQRARSELFTMALEIEQHSHRHVQKLLTAVSLLLQQITTYLHDRMVSYHCII